MSDLTKNIDQWPEKTTGSQALASVRPVVSQINEEGDDVCGLCGLPGADKITHPVYWPGERIPANRLVHAECEHLESYRAMKALTEGERWAFLREL